MKANPITPEQQFQLITECRTSGLSDRAWCLEHDIKPGTFYNWVRRLRKKACYEIPEPTQHIHPRPVCQDVVKVEIVPDHTVAPIVSAESTILPVDQEKLTKSTIEIDCGSVRFHLTNQADPTLVGMILDRIGAGV